MKVKYALQVKKRKANLRCFSFFLILLVIMGLILSGCQSGSEPTSLPKENENETTKQEELPATVVLGTNQIGGSFYDVGTGVAKVLSDYSPIQAQVEPIGGPNIFIPFLETGKLELGLISGNYAIWAYTGINFDKPYKNLRLLVCGHKIPILPLTVRVDSGIKSIKELKGKKVGSEFGGNIEMHNSLTAALESVGLTWDDVLPVPVPDAIVSLRSIQEGSLDASFGGTPVGAQGIEVDSSTPLHALNFGDLPPEQGDNPPEEIVKALLNHLPGSHIARQEKVGILKSDVTLIYSNACLVASSKLSADAAYEITKTLYENYEELHPQHALLKDWKQETMFSSNLYAPYHEGAVRFWKEKGLWTPEAEEDQRKLLEQ